MDTIPKKFTQVRKIFFLQSLEPHAALPVFYHTWQRFVLLQTPALTVTPKGRVGLFSFSFINMHYLQQ